MIPYRLKRHRKRSHGGDSHMALVPFIDMLTILVVFLLVHTSDVDLLPNTKNIVIPQSISDTKPRETLVVMVTKSELLVDGHTVATVADIASSPDPTVAPLQQALLSQANRVLGSAPSDSADASNEREVTIMGDRELPYNVLKKIMATCTQANFTKVSLAVLQKDKV
ncbi:MAG TPA: biopolymer transporter ExbD [Steroidobacteraceae bacterium]|nr:biopolymer transporter ExbD [Steroidobacteraceae bacterium]